MNLSEAAAETGRLEPVVEPDWRSGFTNLLQLEIRRWWTTWRGWGLLAAMTVLLNGLLAYGLWIDPNRGSGGSSPEFVAGTFDVLLFWMSILSVMATIFLAQDALIGEKQAGVAAWILSAPVARGAYILAKFSGYAAGLLAATVWLPGLAIYLQFSLGQGRWLPAVPFIAAYLLQSLYVLFYLALVIALGAFVSSRAAVLAAAFAVLIGQPFLINLVEDAAPPIAWALPARLPELVRFVHRSEPLPSSAGIVLALVFAAVFLALAVWRFAREEL